MTKKLFIYLTPLLLGLLTQCDTVSTERKKTTTAMTQRERDDLKHEGKLFGDPIFSTNKKKKEDPDNGIGVNAYLWRAALDTFSFMPFDKIEPFSGALVTEWYMPPGTQNERVKATVLILDRQLRADGVRVSLFHQKYDQNKGWIDVPVDPEAQEDLERTILTKARMLKHESSIQ